MRFRPGARGHACAIEERRWAVASPPNDDHLERPHHPAMLTRRGSVGGDIRWELPLDRVVQQFMEQQIEAWKREHLVCRYDRDHGYIVGPTAAAVNTLLQYVTTQAVFGSETERDHYAAPLTWLVDHGVP